MNMKRIAVPSNNPGGIDGERSDHFGHCDLFTLVDINEGVIVRVETLDNVDHGAGGCMMPIKLLKDQKVDAIVVGGIGARPLQGFSKVGIDVFFASQQHYRIVKDAVDGMLNGRLTLMEPSQACQGHGKCHDN